MKIPATADLGRVSLALLSTLVIASCGGPGDGPPSSDDTGELVSGNHRQRRGELPVENVQGGST